MNAPLNRGEYEKLCPKGSQPSVLYGLSKIHKQTVNGIPKLRPILCAINTPTYQLAKYFVGILEPYTKNEFTAGDSFTFAEKVRKQNAELFMASLDVDALFTNIPLDETINICIELVFKDNETCNGMNQDEFRTLLTLATKKYFMLFNGQYYQQIDGVAMGSRLGPTLANMFLGYHEVNWFSNCPTEFKPSYYKRYVDDIFVLFQDPDHLHYFKEYMNGQHPTMNFTSEAELDNYLPFLDVQVTRTAGKFITSIYRKPTYSGVYTNYNSFLPLIYKVNLISTLLFRIYTLCSNWSLIHTEIQKVKAVLKKNQFPETLIDKVIKRFLSLRHSTSGTNEKEKSKKTIQIILPFLGTVTGKVERSLQKALKTHLPNYKINVISRASTRLSNLFSFKDKIPSYLNHCVVYKFTCGGCNSTYIGQTTRHIKTRFSEHLGISALTSQPVKGQTPTAVTEHIKKKELYSRLQKIFDPMQRYIQRLHPTNERKPICI